MNRFDLHPYQHKAVEFVLEKRRCGLFLFMGAGKSVISLTAVSDLLDACIIRRVLIVGPLRVITSVWAQEALKWDHLRHLKISIATGSVKQRKAALNANTDLVAINRENIKWLVDLYAEKKYWPFDAVICEESSSFKNPSAKRFRALKKVLPRTTTMILLSGTPAPNSLIDLWSQIYLIDQGETLGKNITAFRRKWCEVDYFGHTWSIKKEHVTDIQNIIKPLCLSMKGADYIQLPDRIDITEKVMLPDKVMDDYKAFEKNLFMEWDGKEIEAISAAVLANKLIQFTSGACYTDEEHNWTTIHTAKLDALSEVIEENASENVIVAYNFKHTLTRLKERFPRAVVTDKGGKAVDAWNRGEIKLLLAHPQSSSFGLNLQAGGSMLIWVDLNWSLELTQQMNARLWRQGQEKPVRIINLVVVNSIDERVAQVLSGKDVVQSDLLKALRG